MARKPRKNSTEDQPGMHKDLKGFTIHINEFGEIKTSMPLDRLNDFLDKNVNDKKLGNQVDKEDISQQK